MFHEAKAQKKRQKAKRDVWMTEQLTYLTSTKMLHYMTPHSKRFHRTNNTVSNNSALRCHEHSGSRFLILDSSSPEFSGQLPVTSE